MPSGAQPDHLFPRHHPVVTPVGDGTIERQWIEYGERMARVKLLSDDYWEGPEEELGDGTIDPADLSGQ